RERAGVGQRAVDGAQQAGVVVAGQAGERGVDHALDAPGAAAVPDGRAVDARHLERRADLPRVVGWIRVLFPYDIETVAGRVVGDVEVVEPVGTPVGAGQPGPGDLDGGADDGGGHVGQGDVAPVGP